MPPIFNWTDTASGTSIIALFHQRGYGVSATRQHTQRPPSAAPVRDEDGEVAGPGFCTSVSVSSVGRLTLGRRRPS